MRCEKKIVSNLESQFVILSFQNFGSTPPLDDSYIRRALTTRSTSFERVVSVDVKNEAKVFMISVNIKQIMTDLVLDVDCIRRL